jgi:hypothetical protein
MSKSDRGEEEEAVMTEDEDHRAGEQEAGELDEQPYKIRLWRKCGRPFLIGITR